MPINVYTILDDPKASTNGGTFAYGINASGQVVGEYTDFTGGQDHGFLYSGGTYTNFDDPDAGPNGQTMARGINDSGRIVGFYNTPFGNEIGFIKTGSSYASIDLNGGGLTQVHGISGLNEVVGGNIASNHSFV